MARENFDRYALVTADNKDNLDVLYEGLAAADFAGVVTYGGTKKVIEQARAERGDGPVIIDPLEFIGDQGLAKRVQTMNSEREQREAIVSHLAPRLWLPQDELVGRGEPMLDLAYVNLREPTGGHKDKGGEFLISSAMEGGRLVAVTPEQIGPMSEWLASEHDPAEGSARRAGLAYAAARYLTDYAAKSEELHLQQLSEFPAQLVALEELLIAET
jgi:hypothetical protein